MKGIVNGLFTLAMISLVLFCVGQTNSEDTKPLVQTYDTGSVDWENGLIYAVGYAAVDTKMENPDQAELMARRGAEVVARRNLLEIIGKVNIDSRSTVNNLMLESDTVSSWIKGCVEGSFITKAWREGNKYFVEVCIPMFGKQTESKSPPVAPGILEGMKKKLSESGAFPTELPKDELSKFDAKEISKYTGIIIEAQGLKINPGLAPTIVDEAGNIIINATDLDSEYGGMAVLMRYSKSLEDAKKIVGENPAVFKASGVNDKGDIVVNKESGGFLKAIKKLGGWIFQSGLLALIL
jgi:hypothetical protein